MTCSYWHRAELIEPVTYERKVCPPFETQRTELVSECLQPGPRGNRETAFYQTIAREIQNDTSLQDVRRLQTEGLAFKSPEELSSGLASLGSNISNTSGRSSEDLSGGRAQDL